MQLLGKRENCLIHAEMAQKGIDYLCTECGSIIRLRSKGVRRAHFFHLSQGSCRQAGKSEVHLANQDYILSLLPKGEAFLEHPFPEISRIADVAWPAKKLIFEVQCSSISLDEARARNRDYEKLGFRVVWILHTRRFGISNRTKTKSFLRASPGYFTSIGASGKGTIYDFDRNKVHLASPKWITPIPKKWPSLLKSRGELYFQGDMTYHALSSPYFLQYLLDKERPKIGKHYYERFINYLLSKIAD